MEKNRVGWQKLILVAVILGFVALIILALLFYCFDMHTQSEVWYPMDYARYVS